MTSMRDTPHALGIAKRSQAYACTNGSKTTNDHPSANDRCVAIVGLAPRKQFIAQISIPTRGLKVSLIAPFCFGRYRFAIAGRSLEIAAELLHPITSTRSVHADPLQNRSQFGWHRSTLSLAHLPTCPIQQIQRQGQRNR